jgi:hypothetical protein
MQQVDFDEPAIRIPVPSLRQRCANRPESMSNLCADVLQGDFPGDWIDIKSWGIPCLVRLAVPFKAMAAK